MTTVSIHMPEQTGLTGQTLYLRKTSDGSLLNTGGDSLTESPASSGRFEATVAEAWTELLHATVKSSGGLAVRDGWLNVGDTMVRDAGVDLSAVGTLANQQTILSRLGTPSNLGSGANISANLVDINSSVSGLAGPGDDTVTIVINGTEGDPVEGVAVWLSTDVDGDDVVAGTLYTDANGEAIFLLTAGATYYLWAHKSGLIDIRASSFVAVAD